MVYALETRPYNQGVRLTATELRHSNVPFKIITDSMAAWTMKTHEVDAVLVGADQVTLNGDTANKIGTYMLAVLANYHSIPFYPVVPITSINLSRQTGDDIPIEERPAKEMLCVNGKCFGKDGIFVGSEDTPVWNPAFDVTPAELITKIITDRGNFTPAELKENIH
ncbi:initiation factor, subunit 2 family protein [Necator americanus]|uniref:Initiation factor, subunit 2 family protein n=1 Tax=Necator americanus TaxID=51031 RepID=W2TS18_NECAM|nr:initiation factor, subunit 2 family protein [Necator americanus]ETN84469.1 initiation factor, subunit 2 family protein [Necator americanus]